MFNNQFGNPQMPYSAYNPYNNYNPMGINNNMPNPSMQPQMQNNLPPKTNITSVTSLQDAMLRPAEPNSIICYADQDKPLIYRIFTDWNNRKTSETLSLTPYVETPPQQNNTSADMSLYVTKEELKPLQEQVEKLLKSAEKPTE